MSNCNTPHALSLFVAVDCGPLPNLLNAATAVSITSSLSSSSSSSSSYGRVARVDCLHGLFFGPQKFSINLTCSERGEWAPAGITGCTGMYSERAEWAPHGITGCTGMCSKREEWPLAAITGATGTYN